MDVETELPAKIDTISSPEKTKDLQNNKQSKPRRRSSRSKTPQKNNEELKIVLLTKKKVTEEINGKNIIEEQTEDIIEDSQKNKCENAESEKGDSEKRCNKNDKEKTENGESKQDLNSDLQETEVNDESKNDENGELSQSEKENLEPSQSENENFEKAETNGEPEKIESVESTSVNEIELEKQIANDEELKDDENESQKENDTEKSDKQDVKDTVEMDQLVVSDEIDVELEFLEESSDKESGKGSPIISRCFTRRSFTRNIPTPKTPKLADQDPDSEKNSVVDHSEENICNLPSDLSLPKTDSMNEMVDSMDTENTSTKAQVGNDLTRLDFVNVNSPTEPDLSYLNRLRDRGLSSRRPIRGAEDYRKRVLNNAAQNKADLNATYEVSTGVKRKNRSATPEETKKFCSDSPSYRNFFTSPIATFRNKFKSDLQSSTPELLAYKDERRNLHFNDNLDIDKIEDADQDEKRSWCSVM